MDNRYEIAEQNGMSREFADWFFDNKKAGCGNVWFVMMAAMWEGWKGSTAMLQGKPAGNSPVITDCWVPCSERMPDNDESKPIAIFTGKCLGQGMFVATYDDDGFFDYWEGMEIIGVTHWMPLPAAPQQEE
ncbi:DUF551 domain-containing protein [Citrobacter sedlakii]